MRIASRLFGVEELVDEGVEESGFDVELICIIPVAGGETEHESDGCWLGNWGERFVIIFAGLLGKTTRYKSSFVGRFRGVGVLEFPDEFGRYDVSIVGARDNRESLVLDVGGHLALGGSLPKMGFGAG